MASGVDSKVGKVQKKDFFNWILSARARVDMNGESILGLQLAVGSFGAILLVPIVGYVAILLVIIGGVGVGFIIDDLFFESNGFETVIKTLYIKKKNPSN